MSAIAERERLITDIASLRRAERTSSAREDIASVRANLERTAGPTVTRAVAARLLSVSQTALDRWIATGDVPLLVTPAGRRELPLRWLVELIEAVRERRQAYPDDRHPLSAVLRTRRSEAQRLNPSALLGHPDRYDGGDGGHRRAELRSLAYHRAVAQRLDEGTVRSAQDRLARWRSQARIDPRYTRQWQALLAQPPAEIAQLIGEDTPRMRELRQSSPFAGALSEPARLRALAIQPGEDPMTAAADTDPHERWSAVDRYIAEHLVPEDPALEAALRDSDAAGLPLIAVTPTQGKLLELLARIHGARTILELGTLGGYSTIWLARALPPGGRLITLEYEPHFAEVARANIARAGVADLVELRVGAALETLPRLHAEGAGPFDLIFIDADKQNYPGYFEWSLKLSRPGTVIVGDNVVRDGAILDPEAYDPDHGDEIIRGVRRFYELVAAEPRVNANATAIQTVGAKGYDGFALMIVGEERP